MKGRKDIGEIKLPDPGRELEMLRGYVIAGMVVWGRGADVRRAGDMEVYVVRHASEEGYEVVKEYSTVMAALWEFYRVTQGGTVNVSDPGQE